MKVKKSTGGKQTVDSDRREFLRKASYSAPTLIVLSLAMHSPFARAQLPSDPNPPNTNKNPNGPGPQNQRPPKRNGGG